MATGHRDINGVELDTLFMAYQSGTKHADCGFRNLSGVDLSQLFQPYTTGAKRGAVGFKNLAGTDLSDLFQNSAVPLFTLGDNIKDAFESFVGLSAIATLDLNTDGSTSSSGFGAGYWGTPSTSGIGSSYECYVTRSGDVLSSGESLLNQWISLGSLRRFQLTASASFGNYVSKSATLSIAVRPASGATAYTASVAMFAEADATGL